RPSATASSATAAAHGPSAEPSRSGATAQPPDEPCVPPCPTPPPAPPPPPGAPAAPPPAPPAPPVPAVEPPAPAVQTASSQMIPGEPRPLPASASQLAWHWGFVRRHSMIDPIWSKRTTGANDAPSSVEAPRA